MLFGPKMMAGANALDVSKLFKPVLWTGSAQTVSGVGFQPDLVWLKNRSASGDHYLTDSVRGVSRTFRTNSTDAEYTAAEILTAFNADGFTVGNNGDGSWVGWSFKRAARFFDIVTWTGNGVDNRDIAHALGVTPALAIVKCRSSARRWVVRTANWRLVLNVIEGAYDLSPPGNEDGYAEITASTPSTLRLKQGSTLADVNASGETYEALLFADDTASDGCVRVVEYSGNGSADGPVITLGFSPQFLLIKRIDGGGNWWLLDSARGMDTTTDPMLRANAIAGDFTAYGDVVERSPTGFKLKTADNNINGFGSSYLVLAIREP